MERKERGEQNTKKVRKERVKVRMERKQESPMEGRMGERECVCQRQRERETETSRERAREGDSETERQ